MKNDYSLADSINLSMQKYFDDLHGEQPHNLYRFFMDEVEKPFLQSVLRHTKGNQSQAAKMLGINRNTLRKKMAQYQLT